jgi:hypothetical protein
MPTPLSTYCNGQCGICSCIPSPLMAAATPKQMTDVQVKERPILFSGPMVQALLAGTKTQTRRAAKHPLAQAAQRILSYKGQSEFDCVLPDETGGIILCPYGKPGDRLWVRETWAAHWMYNDVPPNEAHSSQPDDNQWFAADPDGTVGTCGCPSLGYRGKWRPSIFMPRWASRLLLEITAVRCERLQDISEGDAVAEGITGLTKDGQTVKYGVGEPSAEWPWTDWQLTAKEAYSLLWGKINGPESWEANPWVWVVEFKVI